MWTRCVVGAFVLLFAVESQAERREGVAEKVEHLSIDLPFAVQFLKQTVPPGKYKISVAGQRLTFAATVSMVTVATIATRQPTLTRRGLEPRAVVKRRGDEVRIIARYRDRTFRVTGRVVKYTATTGPRVSDEKFGTKEEAAVASQQVPKISSDKERLAALLERYSTSVDPCLQQAKQRRWKTDHPYFKRCVCSLTNKWRLRGIKPIPRVHYILQAGRYGMSFGVNANGRVRSCRVWRGGKPPKDEPKGLNLIRESRRR